LPLAQPPLPRVVAGLIEMLGEYQALAAEAAWAGGRADAIRALASNPLVCDLRKAQVVYDELAAAHRALLPERLLR
jgi:6-phospho-beta-glucosidase